REYGPQRGYGSIADQFRRFRFQGHSDRRRGPAQAAVPGGILQCSEHVTVSDSKPDIQYAAVRDYHRDHQRQPGHSIGATARVVSERASGAPRTIPSSQPTLSLRRSLASARGAQLRHTQLQADLSISGVLQSVVRIDKLFRYRLTPS